MELDREKAQAIIEGSEAGWTRIKTTITGVSRWSIHSTAICEFEGRFYQLDYKEAATEIQDEVPFEWAEEPITIPEVVAVEKVMTVYLEVKTP